MPIHRTPLLDQFFIAITWAGSLAVLLPLVVGLMLLLLFRGRQEEAWLLGVGFGGAVAAAHLLKVLVGRPRPDLLPALVPMPMDLSFPSAHTAQITAVCLCLLMIACRSGTPLLCWSAGLGGIVLVACVGYSRIYLQVHYPSDVIAGFLMSVVWVLMGRILLARLMP